MSRRRVNHRRKTGGSNAGVGVRAADENFAHQRAPNRSLRQVVKTPPQASSAQQMERFRRQIGPRHAPDAFLDAAARAWVDNPIAAPRRAGFDYSHRQIPYRNRIAQQAAMRKRNGVYAARKFHKRQAGGDLPAPGARSSIEDSAGPPPSCLSHVIARKAPIHEPPAANSTYQGFCV
jgi:hypothetical protein